MTFDKTNSDLTNSPKFREPELEAMNRRLESMMLVMQADLNQIKHVLKIPKSEKVKQTLHQMTGIAEDEREDLYVTDSSPVSQTSRVQKKHKVDSENSVSVSPDQPTSRCFDIDSAMVSPAFPMTEYKSPNNFSIKTKKVLIQSPNNTQLRELKIYGINEEEKPLKAQKKLTFSGNPQIYENTKTSVSLKSEP